MSKVMRRRARVGRYDDAVEAFRNLERYGVKEDAMAMNILMDPLAKGNSVEHAYKVFLEFEDCIPLSSLSFNVLIHGWCKARKLEDAQKDMEEKKKHGFSPDVVTYTIVMHALGKAKQINAALDVHEIMRSNGCLTDTSFYNSLIFILSQAGRLKDANETFEDMKRQGVMRDVMTSNTMIASACAHSREENALKLLQKMEKDSCKPQLKTYAPLLKMCCRKKRMKLLQYLLSHMFKNDVSIDVGSYAFLVRGFRKSGKLELACSFKEMVPKGMIPKHGTCKLLVKELEGKSMAKAKEQIEMLMSQAKAKERV